MNECLPQGLDNITGNKYDENAALSVLPFVWRCVHHYYQTYLNLPSHHFCLSSANNLYRPYKQSIERGPNSPIRPRPHAANLERGVGTNDPKQRSHRLNSPENFPPNGEGSSVPTVSLLPLLEFGRTLVLLHRERLRTDMPI
jgi:hypothetical protein